MFKSPYKWLWLVGFLFFVVLFLLWPFGGRHVGSSNLPSFSDNDVVLSNRWAKPTRGDFVFFQHSQYGETTLFSGVRIKRIVAISGDKIRMTNGKISVNAVPLDESELWAYWEQHGGVDTSSYLAHSNSWPFRKDFGKSQDYTVPDGMVFVMGDNRSMGGSEDSRVFGPIKTSAIIAVVGPVIYPAWRSLQRPKGFEALNAQLAKK